ncbi:MAG: oligosaccharide flippase family protein [bacterium]
MTATALATVRSVLVRIKTDSLLRDSFNLTLAFSVLNLANWLYHVVMSRTLDPVGYGSLSALLGMLLVLTVPVTTIQMGLSTVVARAHARGETAGMQTLLSASLRLFLWLGMLTFALVALLSGKLASVLQLASPTPPLIAGTVLLSWSVLPVLRGILQGAGRFGALGLSFAAEGLLKLGAGTALVMVGLGLEGAIAGVSLAGFGALALTLLPLRGQIHFKRQDDDVELAGVLRQLVPFGVALGCFTLLTQADVILVKAFFPPQQAGIYAAASTAGKVILNLTGALAMVTLPELTRQHSTAGDGRSVLARGLLYAGLGGGAALVLYFLAPQVVVRVLFGDAYLAAVPLLGLLGLTMLAYELTLLIIYYLLATGQPGFLKPLSLITVAFPLLMRYLAHSPEGVAWIMTALSVLTLLTVSWFCKTPNVKP